MRGVNLHTIKVEQCYYKSVATSNFLGINTYMCIPQVAQSITHAGLQLS